MKFLLACIGFIFIVSFTNGSKLFTYSDDLIPWNSEYKLKWDDFQGASQNNSKYKAITSSRIDMNPINFNDSIIEYEFQCYFEKDKSWVKEMTLNLLKHEQLHFDITELSTRKMRQKFSKIILLDIKVFKEQVKELFQEGLEERINLNERYDYETNHGIIQSKQKEWEVKIAKELKALQAFSNSKVVIKR